jgi:apolipoprotein N-acyltransferase
VTLPDGSRGEAAGWMERRALTASVPTGQVITPYVRYGDVVYRLAFGLQFLVVLTWVGAIAFFPAKAETASR